MKAITLLLIACFPVLMSCEKLGPFIGNTDDYEPSVMPELVKSRAREFAHRYGSGCWIEKQQVVYEPMIYINSMPDSVSWRKGRMNKDMNVFCDSVLRDHRDLLPKLEVRFNVFFYSPSGRDLGNISFDYKDLTQYPFPF